MIQELRIQNFRSLRDVTLNLQPVNLLIGPNNCGKTNVLKALKFFSEILAGDFADKKEIERLRFRDYGKFGSDYLNNPVQLTIKDYNSIFENAPYHYGVIAEYGFTGDNKRPDFAAAAGTSSLDMSVEPINPISIIRKDDDYQSIEAVICVEELSPAVVMPVENGRGTYTTNSSGYVYTGNVYTKQNDERQMTSTGPANLGMYKHGLTFGWTFHELQKLLIYGVEPSTLLSPYPTNGEVSVASDASNLISFPPHFLKRILFPTFTSNGILFPLLS